jgi:hypothetical protein
MRKTMKASRIQVLKPNVTQEEAIREFRSGLVRAAYWRILDGPMQRIADAYVPFWIYRVRYPMGGATKTRFFALDAVHGTLDLFEFPRIPGESDLMERQTRNRLEPRLSADAAHELLRTKVLRVLFQQGFFKLRDFTLEIERVAMEGAGADAGATQWNGEDAGATRQWGELYLPYWLAFYGRQQAAKCRVLDAVRRRIEGAKAASFFQEWLAA